MASSFSHHVLRYADVKITRAGDTTRYEFDASPANRIVIEVHKGGLALDAAIARGHTQATDTGHNPAKRKDSK